MVSNEEIKRKLNDRKAGKKHCPNCNMEYDENARFCRICGSSLISTFSHNQIDIPHSKYCPNCDIGFKENARFCRICGSTLISATSHNRQAEQSNFTRANNNAIRDNPKYCPKCNIRFKENAEFCNKCGSSLIRISPQTQKSSLKQTSSKVIPKSTTSIAPRTQKQTRKPLPKSPVSTVSFNKETGRSNLKQTNNALPKSSTSPQTQESALKQTTENLPESPASTIAYNGQTEKFQEYMEEHSNDLYGTESFERYEAEESVEYMIDIRNLKKSYDKRSNVLNGIDLKIKKGEFVSIIGPSGSGKSTLLNMIGALDKADGGIINVAGIDLMLNDDLSQFRSKEIGFIFQLHNLIPNLTVVENVEIPMYENDYSAEYMRSRAVELLEAVGLADKLYQIPNELSGGQMQRVAIARALVNHPSIILADEPTGALDSKTGDVILELMKDIHEKENVTLIMVTHAPYVANMADRVISVLDGEIKSDYSP